MLMIVVPCKLSHQRVYITSDSLDEGTVIHHHLFLCLSRKTLEVTGSFLWNLGIDRLWIKEELIKLWKWSRTYPGYFVVFKDILVVSSCEKWKWSSDTKLSYHRRTMWRAMSVEILSIAAQQYEKSRLKRLKKMNDLEGHSRWLELSLFYGW